MSDRTWFRRTSDAPPLPADIVELAAVEGERAARAGQYDEWSFEGNTVAYFERLDAQREQAVQNENEMLVTRLEQIDAAAAAAATAATIGRQQAQITVEHARKAMEREQDARDRTRAELDLLTGWHDPLPPGHEEGDGYAGDRDPAESGPMPPVPRSVWMGPADGTLSPPVPRWLKAPVVLLLATLEVPVYFAIFRAFNPRDLALNWAFTLPVALSMVLAPHFVGIWLRKRFTRPGLGRVPLIASTAVMTVWLATALELGYLRGQSLAGSTVVGGVTVTSEVSSLGLFTLTAVFSLLIVLSGLVSFMLGIADDHPGVAAYEAANRNAEAAELAHLETSNVHAEAGITGPPPEIDPMEAAQEQSRHRIEAIRARYRAARAAYLDALALHSGNPSLTQASGAAARHVEEPQKQSQS